MLEGGPLLQDWWVELAKADFIPYLNVTALSPREGKATFAPDQGMLSEKGGRGFPHCIFMDSSGKVVTETRPSDEPSFRSALAPVTRLFGFKRAFEAEPSKVNEANYKLTAACMEPDEEAFDQLRKLSEVEGIDASAKGDFVALLHMWPIRKRMMAFEKEQQSIRSQEEFDAAAAKLYPDLFRLYQDGIEITDGNAPYFTEFWDGLLNHGLKVPDKKLAMKAVQKLLDKHGDNDRAKRYLDAKKAEVEAL